MICFRPQRKLSCRRSRFFTANLKPGMAWPQRCLMKRAELDRVWVLGKLVLKMEYHPMLLKYSQEFSIFPIMTRWRNCRGTNGNVARILFHRTCPYQMSRAPGTVPVSLLTLRPF